MVRVLVAEDDLHSQRLMQAIVKSQGWECTMASDGAEAWEAFSNAPRDFDLLIVDVMMPSVDGLELCRRVRSISATTPVIITSALGEDDKVVQGIEAGADDYLPKPINVQILIAKMQRALARGESEHGAESTVFECGDMAIDVQARRVTRSGNEIRLTKLEFGVLEFLVSEKNHVRTPEEILRSVWGEEYADDVAILRAVIRRLRKKVEPDPSVPRHIVTHVGTGYSCSDLPASQPQETSVG